MNMADISKYISLEEVCNAYRIEVVDTLKNRHGETGRRIFLFDSEGVILKSVKIPND